MDRSQRVLRSMLEIGTSHDSETNSSGFFVFLPTPSNSLTRHGVLQFNLILILSTWQQNQISEVKGSVSQDFPQFRCQSQVQVVGYLCFWLTGCQSEVPTTPSMGLMNLLEWLPELRNNSRKDITQAQPPHASGEVWGNSQPPSACSTLPRSHVHRPGGCPHPSFCGFYGGFITEAWWIKPLVVGDLQPPSPPWS